MRRPTLARGYLSSMVLAAIAMQTFWLVAWPRAAPSDLGLMGLLAALAVLAQHFPVTVGRQRKVDVSTAAYFASVLLFSAPLAVALVGFSHLVGQATLALRRNPISGKRLRSPRSVLFNTSQAMVATGLSALAYHAFVPQAGTPDAWENLWAVPVAAAAMYVSNSLAVAIMVAIQQGQNVTTVWAAGRRQSALEFAGLFLIGFVIARGGARDPLIVAAMVLPTAIIYWSMDRTVRLEESARREAELAAWRDLERMKNEFMRSVSHELSAPLALVYGFAELLRTQTAEAPPADPDITELAEQVYVHAKLLTRLVDDLLDFGRIKAGEIALEPEDFDLVPVLQDLLIGLRRQPGGQRLVAAGLPLTLPVHADQTRVAQAVFNLVTNAQKYAPAGPITLSARLVDDPGHAHPARIEVADQGPGIAAQDQPHVWEKFYRGQSVVGLTSTPGTGLGLAIVKTLTEAQGGRVGLESTPGHGARFWIELPAAEASTALRQASRAYPAQMARLFEGDAERKAG